MLKRCFIVSSCSSFCEPLPLSLFLLLEYISLILLDIHSFNLSHFMFAELKILSKFLLSKVVQFLVLLFFLRKCQLVLLLPLSNHSILRASIFLVLFADACTSLTVLLDFIVFTFATIGFRLVKTKCCPEESIRNSKDSPEYCLSLEELFPSNCWTITEQFLRIHEKRTNWTGHCS